MGWVVGCLVVAFQIFPPWLVSLPTIIAMVVMVGVSTNHQPAWSVSQPSIIIHGRCRVIIVQTYIE